MAIEVRSTTWVATPPAQVWRVLSDLPSYRQWHPRVADAAGALLDDEPVRLRPRLRWPRRISLRLRVAAVQPGWDVQLRRVVLAPRLLRADVRVQLDPVGHGTRVSTSVRLRGALAPLLTGLTDRLQRALDDGDVALRTRAELQLRQAS